MGVPDEELITSGNAIVKGCTGNASYKFTNELTNAVGSLATFAGNLALCKHGNEADTSKKNDSKVFVVDDFRVLGTQVNVQAAGDRVKALSSGFPLEKEQTHQMMGEVKGFHVENTSIAGAIFVSVQKPPTYLTHGTIFGFWDPALGPTPADKNKWFHKHSNGNSLTLSGFTPGVIYPFAAAYKGLDSEALVWSATTDKMAGD